MTLADLTYDELEALVRSWSWWTPDHVAPVGVPYLISGVVRGLRLPGVTLDRDRTALISATLVLPREVVGQRACCCTSNTPLIAALMVCWVALLRLGRALPPELDELIGGSLGRGSLHPQSFGVTWAEVDTLYSSGGRTPPTEVLARAAVELASGRGAQRVKG